MRISDWSSDVCSSDLRGWMTRESYLIGYARVSKGDDQSNATQRRALDALGCKRVFEETASGGRWDRPKPLELIGPLREGRLEERRVGNECVGMCGSVGVP